MNLHQLWINLDKTKLSHFTILLLVLCTSVVVTLYSQGAEDEEKRQTLLAYTHTIERSIDWQPFAQTLNTDPSRINPHDLDALNLRLNQACKANPDCHFIYLAYPDNQAQGRQIKFLLDASPQPPSEISKLGDVYNEATEAFKSAMDSKTMMVEGPHSDQWGIWISAVVPVEITRNTPHFVMLAVDVADSTWSGYIIKKIVAPIVVTLIFLSIVIGFIYQSRLREKLLMQLYDATTALSNMANSDGLTGLPNRRLLEDRMQEAIKRAKRSKEVVAVMFLDLDYFKAVNDSYGHAIGDILLKNVAERLQTLLRGDDTIARIGGDEFIVLLSQKNEEAEVTIVAERIVHALVKPFYINGLVLQIGVSVGISLYPAHDMNPDILMKYADNAMYTAKQGGRNRYSIFTKKIP